MVVKVVELVGSSQRNWTDAVDCAVAAAAEKAHHICGVEVTNFTARVENGHIVEYRANLKLAYGVE